MPKQVEPLCDGSAITTWPNGRWDLCLPSGKHTGGKEADQAKALEAAHAEHDKFVLGQSPKGRGAQGNVWVCPLVYK